MMSIFLGKFLHLLSCTKNNKTCLIKYEIFPKKSKFTFKSINVNNNSEFESAYFLVLTQHRLILSNHTLCICKYIFHQRDF